MAAGHEANRDAVARFEELCRAHKIPVTVQRRAVLQAVIDRDDHPTADQVYDVVHAKLPGVSRTTVYRVLDMLVNIGVISKACHPGATARYDRTTEQHYHLICLHCDKVIDLHDASIDSLPLPDTKSLGFEIKDYRVQLRGVCSACRKKLGKTGSKDAVKSVAPSRQKDQTDVQRGTRKRRKKP